MGSDGTGGVIPSLECTWSVPTGVEMPTPRVVGVWAEDCVLHAVAISAKTVAMTVLLLKKICFISLNVLCINVLFFCVLVSDLQRYVFFQK